MISEVDAAFSITHATIYVVHVHHVIQRHCIRIGYLVTLRLCVKCRDYLYRMGYGMMITFVERDDSMTAFVKWHMAVFRMIIFIEWNMAE